MTDPLRNGTPGASSSLTACTVRNLVDAVAKIRHQKQCATVVRIHKAVRQQLQRNVDVEEIIQQLNIATTSGSLWRVDNNGVTSYREPPKGTSKEHIRWPQKETTRWPAKEPAPQIGMSHVKYPMSDHLAQPAPDSSMFQHMAEQLAWQMPENRRWPVAEPMTWSMTEPVRQHITDSMGWPVTESFRRPVTDPVAWPAPDQYRRTMTEPLAWPDTLAWQMTEPWRQSMVEQFRRPVTEPLVWPITETPRRQTFETLPPKASTEQQQVRQPTQPLQWPSVDPTQKPKCSNNAKVTHQSTKGHFIDMTAYPAVSNRNMSCSEVESMSQHHLQQSGKQCQVSPYLAPNNIRETSQVDVRSSQSNWSRDDKIVSNSSSRSVKDSIIPPKRKEIDKQLDVHCRKSTMGHVTQDCRMKSPDFRMKSVEERTSTQAYNVNSTSSQIYNVNPPASSMANHFSKVVDGEWTNSKFTLNDPYANQTFCEREMVQQTTCDPICDAYVNQLVCEPCVDWSVCEPPIHRQSMCDKTIRDDTVERYDYKQSINQLICGQTVQPGCETTTLVKPVDIPLGPAKNELVEDSGILESLDSKNPLAFESFLCDDNLNGIVKEDIKESTKCSLVQAMCERPPELSFQPDCFENETFDQNMMENRSPPVLEDEIVNALPVRTGDSECAAPNLNCDCDLAPNLNCNSKEGASELEIAKFHSPDKYSPAENKDNSCSYDVSASSGSFDKGNENCEMEIETEVNLNSASEMTSCIHSVADASLPDQSEAVSPQLPATVDSLDKCVLTISNSSCLSEAIMKLLDDHEEGCTIENLETLIRQSYTIDQSNCNILKQRIRSICRRNFESGMLFKSGHAYLRSSASHMKEAASPQSEHSSIDSGNHDDDNSGLDPSTDMSLPHLEHATKDIVSPSSSDVARFPDCHEDELGITSERCSFSDEHQINPANNTKSTEQFSEEDSPMLLPPELLKEMTSEEYNERMLDDITEDPKVMDTAEVGDSNVSTDLNVKGLVDGLSRFFTPSNKRCSRVSQNAIRRANEIEKQSASDKLSASKKSSTSKSDQKVVKKFTSKPSSDPLVKSGSSRIPFVDHTLNSGSSQANQRSAGARQREQLIDGLSHFFTAEGKRRTCSLNRMTFDQASFKTNLCGWSNSSNSSGSLEKSTKQSMEKSSGCRIQSRLQARMRSQSASSDCDNCRSGSSDCFEVPKLRNRASSIGTIPDERSTSPFKTSSAKSNSKNVIDAESVNSTLLSSSLARLRNTRWMSTTRRRPDSFLKFNLQDQLSDWKISNWESVGIDTSDDTSSKGPRSAMVRLKRLPTILLTVQKSENISFDPSHETKEDGPCRGNVMNLMENCRDRLQSRRNAKTDVEPRDVAPPKVTPDDMILFRKSQKIAAERILVSSGLNNPDSEPSKSFSVRLGSHHIPTFFKPEYPKEFASLSTLYVCEFCLSSLKSPTALHKHSITCGHSWPPGDEIYRLGDLSVFEVDGGTSPVYCQNLGFLSRLFDQHKYEHHFDLSPFTFYVLTRKDNSNPHFLGFFVKDVFPGKMPRKQSKYVFHLHPPSTSKTGVRFLPHKFQEYFAISGVNVEGVQRTRPFCNIGGYHLNKLNNIYNGTPMNPLPAPVLAVFNHFWARTIAQYLELHWKANQSLTVKAISQNTGIATNDVVSTLSSLGIISSKTNVRGLFIPNAAAVKECIGQLQRKYRDKINFDSNYLRFSSNSKISKLEFGSDFDSKMDPKQMDTDNSDMQTTIKSEMTDTTSGLLSSNVSSHSDVSGATDDPSRTSLKRKIDSEEPVPRKSQSYNLFERFSTSYSSQITAKQEFPEKSSLSTGDSSYGPPNKMNRFESKQACEAALDRCGSESSTKITSVDADSRTKSEPMSVDVGKDASSSCTNVLENSSSTANSSTAVLPPPKKESRSVEVQTDAYESSNDSSDDESDESSSDEESSSDSNSDESNEEESTGTDAEKSVDNHDSARNDRDLPGGEKTGQATLNLNKEPETEKMIVEEMMDDDGNKEQVADVEPSHQTGVDEDKVGESDLWPQPEGVQGSCIPPYSSNQEDPSSKDTSGSSCSDGDVAPVPVDDSFGRPSQSCIDSGNDLALIDSLNKPTIPQPASSTNGLSDIMSAPCVSDPDAFCGSGGVTSHSMESPMSKNSNADVNSAHAIERNSSRTYSDCVPMQNNYGKSLACGYAGQSMVQMASPADSNPMTSPASNQGYQMTNASNMNYNNAANKVVEFSEQPAAQFKVQNEAGSQYVPNSVSYPVSNYSSSTVVSIPSVNCGQRNLYIDRSPNGLPLNQNSPNNNNNCISYSMLTPSPTNSSSRSFNMASPTANSYHSQVPQMYDRGCPSAPALTYGRVLPSQPPPSNASDTQIGWPPLYHPQTAGGYSIIKFQQDQELLPCNPTRAGMMTPGQEPQHMSAASAKPSKSVVSSGQAVKLHRRCGKSCKTGNAPPPARSQTVAPNVTIQPGTNMITNYNVLNMNVAPDYRTQSINYPGPPYIANTAFINQAQQMQHLNIYQHQAINFPQQGQPSHNGMYAAAAASYGYLNGAIAQQSFNINVNNIMRQ